MHKSLLAYAHDIGKGSAPIYPKIPLLSYYPCLTRKYHTGIINILHIQNIITKFINFTLTFYQYFVKLKISNSLYRNMLCLNHVFRDLVTMYLNHLKGEYPCYLTKKYRIVLISVCPLFFAISSYAFAEKWDMPTLTGQNLSHGKYPKSR